MLLANELRRIIGRHGRLHKSLWDGAIGVLCKILQINKVNKFSKLLTFINGGVMLRMKFYVYLYQKRRIMI